MCTRAVFYHSRFLIPAVNYEVLIRAQDQTSFYFLADFYPGCDTDTQKCYITMLQCTKALTSTSSSIHLLWIPPPSLSISVCHTNVPSQTSTLKPHQWASGIRLRGVITSARHRWSRWCCCSSLVDVISMRCPTVHQWRSGAIKWHRFEGFWHANAAPRGKFVPAFVTGTDC